MLVLDSTVFIAALDRARISHHTARDLIASDVTKAVTTQTMRESLAVATRPMAANGLGMDISIAWTSIMAMRMACDRLLYETDTWWASYDALVRSVKPGGRSIYDLGQVAHVHSLGKPARLLTDDDGLCARYQGQIDVVTVSAYR